MFVSGLGVVMTPVSVFAEETPQINFGLSYGANTGLGSGDIRNIIANIIRVALSLLGILAVAGIVYGGFMYMTAGGNEEKSSGGTKAIAAGVIGLVIILAAYSIANFVLRQLYKATSNNNDTYTEVGLDESG